MATITGSFNSLVSGSLSGVIGTPGPAGPAGPTGPQGIQGIQGVPGQGVAAGGTTGQVLKKLSSANYDTGWSSDISGVAWGAITGTLSAQTDLQNALDAKLSTSAASSTYLPLAGGYITGDIQSLNGSEFRTFQSTNSAIIRPYQIQLGDAVGTLTIDAEGISFNSSPFKQTLPFLGLAGYATEGWVTSNFYPLTGNPSGFLTASALTPYSTTVQADALYYPLTGNPSAFITASALTPYLLSATAATTYQTLAGMSSYLTTATAATTYYLQTNPDGFITSAALADYLPLAGGTMAGQIFSDFGNGYTSTLSDTGLSVTWSAGDSYLAPDTIGFNTPAGMSTLKASELYLVDSNTGNEISVTANGLNTVASITFQDSTVQTTAYTGGGGLITSVTAPLVVTSGDLSVDLTGYATETFVTTQGYITQGTADGLYYPLTGNPSGFLTSVPPPALTGLTSDISWDTYSNTGRFLITGGNSGDGMSFSARVNFSDFVPNQPESGDFWRNDNKFQYRGTIGTVQTIASESWVTSQGYATTGQLSAYAPLAGATFTGKINLATIGVATPSINLGGQCDSAPASATNGDLWISNAAAPKLTYRMAGVNYNLPVLNQFNTFTNQMVIDTTSSSVAALRVTQRGAGNAIEVEDSTTPDATSFIITNSGNVGIGVATGYTATQKVEVVGNVKADAFINGTGPTYNVKAIQAHSAGADTHELLVSVNGSTYRVGMRFVSTP